MARYVCECHHYIEDISDLVVVHARDMFEAVEKARRIFCNKEHECIENTSCHCKYEEDEVI